MELEFRKRRVLSHPKSLSEALSSISFAKDPLYTSIWTGRSPKKVKFFIWELSYNSTNTQDNLQLCCLWITLSPNCSPIWKKSSESALHLFAHCPYALAFWDFINKSFGWPAPRPGDIHTLLSSYLVGHPFRKETKILWECFIPAFFLEPLDGAKRSHIFRKNSQHR